MVLQGLLFKGNGFHAFILLREQFNFKWKICLSRTFRQNMHTRGKMQLSNMCIKMIPFLNATTIGFSQSADLLHT